jgi:hypothetical protein
MALTLGLPKLRISHLVPSLAILLDYSWSANLANSLSALCAIRKVCTVRIELERNIIHLYE